MSAHLGCSAGRRRQVTNGNARVCLCMYDMMYAHLKGCITHMHSVWHMGIQTCNDC